MDVKSNPIATADQAAIERRAFEVLAHPLVKATVEEVRKAWPELVAGQMDKATLAIHTTKPQRPKPPRKPEPEAAQ